MALPTVQRAWRALRPHTWSVRTRLSAVAVISAAVGLIVAAIVSYVVAGRVLHDQIDASLQRPPALSPSPESNLPDSAEHLCEVISSARRPAPGLFTAQVVTADGSVCADPAETGLAFTDSDFAAADDGSGSTMRDGEFEDGTPARVAVVPLEDGGALLLARDVSAVNSLLAALRWSLVGVVLIGILIALTLSRSAARAGLSPITRFARVAEDIAETGDPGAHAATLQSWRHRHASGDELERLAHAFSSMTTALADAQATQRRMVADAGHELRTPLASLRANIALLQRTRRLDRPLPPEEEDRLLNDLRNQAVELSALIDDLADLASAETDRAVRAPVRFDHVVEAAIERARPRADGHDFQVRLEPWTTRGDAAGIERATVNLLDNAVKFSPAGSVIEVELAAGVLTVSDRGVGVPAGDEAKAFDRFWRSPGARSLPGSGLGLSIVADVARHHGGWARLEARPGGGCVARLALPVDSSSSGT